MGDGLDGSDGWHFLGALGGNVSCRLPSGAPIRKDGALAQGLQRFFSGVIRSYSALDCPCQKQVWNYVYVVRGCNQVIYVIARCRR